ncbi:restriction endonuclease subunit S [Bordetella sp. N]|uniref:restriction endonuclease subunit S n=1 Tax=Bordetella sp. N TaxID=1746199 RepID=UPI00070E1A47|nr:restriction endonuclease subunit S [Bordetella sp. N]ALM85334.1 restriction endonuclease subunit R [Bordetella sp. N]
MSSKNKTTAAKEEAKPALVPKLRFPEFQSAGDWTTVELGAVATIRTEKVGNNICVPMSITSGVGLVSQEEKFGRVIAGDSYKNYVLLKPYDFAYNKSATKEYPEGFLTLYSGAELAAVPNSIFTCFRVNGESPDVRFLNYQFSDNLHGRWLRKFIQVGARAHGSLSINDNDLMALPVPVPAGTTSVAEQKKIAECLSSVDELIAAHARKVDALKTHKKGLMRQLFPREGETQPRLRFPEFQNAGKWDFKPFEEFVTKSFYGTSSSTSPTGKYPVLRMGNMLDGGLDFTNLVYIDLDPDSFESFRLEDGDILLNRTNSPALVGKISLFRLKSECMTASYIVTYRLNKKRIDPSFCNSMLNTPLYQARIRSFAKPSVSQVNINPTTFKKDLIVSVPSLPEQERIASCLSSLDALITTETQKLEALKTHKKGLMQQLFPSPEEVEA